MNDGYHGGPSEGRGIPCVRANLQVSALVDIACLRPCGEGGYCVNLAGTAGCRSIHLLWIVCMDWGFPLPIEDPRQAFQDKVQIKTVHPQFSPAARASRHFPPPQHHHVPSRQSPPHAMQCHAPPACPCFLPPTCFGFCMLRYLSSYMHTFRAREYLPPPGDPPPRRPPSPNPIVQPYPAPRAPPNSPHLTPSRYRTPSKSPDSSPPTLHHAPRLVPPQKRTAPSYLAQSLPSHGGLSSDHQWVV